ncbi:hypothetical protein GC096_18555 [Paenibacillus sp. LMG 31461]|uniref:S-layer homology domain-containing protein n=1 Tax=Paenibacillus plantarum TaxID=2654975 RepID=A0ABX1XCC1_9BACL|nr:S-layer homology domain-containing protein [Paenibacillus plantarum]NOU66041.1 hypothetical protein [Paenibacillus plantarum]
MKIAKRALNMLLFLSLVVSMFTGVIPVSGAIVPAVVPLFHTTDGSVMFEAEDTSINTTYVTVTNTTYASGGKAILLSKEVKPPAPAPTPVASDPGGLEFQITPDMAGKYQIWMRYVCISASCDSQWASINGGDYKYMGPPPISKDTNDYVWVKYDTFGSLVEGQTYSYRILPRETGAKIDKFIVTAVANFTPSGMGTLPDPIVVGARTPLNPNAYPMPPITPPAEHPRLLFKTSDIPTLRANLAAAENGAAVAAYNELLANTSDGNLPDKPGSYNFDGKLLGVIEAKAFEYAINGNEAYGRQALSMMKNVLKTVTFKNYNPDPERPMGQVIFTASQVYDWCYPLLTKEDKEEIVAGSEHIAANADGGTITGMEIGWPPNKQGAVTGHGSEAQLQRDLLSFGIATYDEYPDIYNYVGGRFFAYWPQARNYWATSNTQHQGSAYGPYRYDWDLWSQWIINRMSGDTIYVPDAGLTSYQWIYTRRPDGQLLREGDEYNEGGTRGSYWNILSPTLLHAANFYKDPYLKKELLRENPLLSTFTYSNFTITPVQVLLFNDPAVGVKPLSGLPLTKYFGSPVGQMVARTGWNDGINAPDVMAFMKIGEQWAANHNHLDVGNFQIYYKGILASESGFYDSYNTPHDLNYNKQTIAHNSLLIYDPNEQMSGSIVNSGGQRTPGGEVGNLSQWMKDGKYEMGVVTGHEFGPDPVKPDYTYLSGDITKAYSDKVKQVLRSMMFLPLDNADHPAAFIVMDKIKSSDPAFKKTFLLHSQQEPEIDGNVTVIKRNTEGYNGMLTNQTLLPKNPLIDKLGGPNKEYLIGGSNYPLKTTIDPVKNSTEAGWGRVEISPSSQNETDYFLNVMYVGDADKNLAVENANLIETDVVAGAKIFDKVAIFAKDSARLDQTVTFDVYGSDTALKVNIAGLKEGTWAVTVDNAAIGEQIATADGGMIYFTAPAGHYTLNYVSGNADKPVVPEQRPDHEGIDIKINNMFLYSAASATIQNNVVFVPMREVLENMKATYSWDEATLSATAVNGNQTIKLTNNSATAYIDGEAKLLEAPAKLINGSFMMPASFISEAMDAQVVWDPFGRGVHITFNRSGTNPPSPLKEGVAQIISSKASKVFEETYPYLSYDGNPDTLWSAEGTAEWISYEFRKPQTIASVYMHFNKATARRSYFDIQSSTDGINYSTLFSGEGDGLSEGQEYFLEVPATAQYFRILCKGNSASSWNAIKEIEFRLANSAKAITAFSFAGLNPAVNGTIDETNKTIALTVPYGTDVTALVPTFTSTGDSVKLGSTVQVSGTTPQNFTSGITYTVVAADSTIQNYTVTVTVSPAVGGGGSEGSGSTPSTNALLASLTVNQVAIAVSPSQLDYTVDVPNSVTSLNFNVTKAESNQTLTVTGSVYKTETGAVYSTVIGNVYSYKTSDLIVGNNPIQIVVTAQNGTSNTYNLIMNREKIIATAAPIPVTNEPLNISAPAGVNASIQAEPTIIGSTAHVTLPLVEVTATTSLGNVSVTIPSGTTVTAPAGWNGIINLPQAHAINSVTTNGTVNAVIEVGSSAYSLYFDKAVRIVLPGQSGTNVGFVSAGNTIVTPITTVLTTDSQAVGDALPAGGEGKIDSGSDLVIWTKHFTKFVSYTATPTSTLTTGGGGGGSSNSATIIASIGGTETINGVTIDFPEGAFASNFKVTVNKASSTTGLPKDATLKLIGDVYEITKDKDGKFTKAVTIKLPFDIKNVDFETSIVSIYWLNEETKEWIQLDNIQVDKDTGTVTGSTNHFTKFAVLTSARPTDAVTPVAFSDIAGHWSEANIKQAVSDGIVSGYPDGTFKPENAVTRAEFTVMLMNTLKPKVVGAALTFADSSKIGTWAQKAVAQAVQAGVINGYEDGTFHPDAQITRAEMAAMFAGALGQSNEVATTTGFADDKDIPVWAKSRVVYVKQAGIVQGREKNLFAPNDHATKAEAVTVLLNLLAQKSK